MGVLILVIGKHGQLAKCFRELEPDAYFLSSQQINLCETKKIQDILSLYKPSVICNFAAFNNVDDAENNINNNLINSEAVLELGKFSMAKKFLSFISLQIMYSMAARVITWKRTKRIL